MDDKRPARFEHVSDDTIFALVRFASAWWLPWLAAVVMLILMTVEPSLSPWKYVYAFGSLAFCACTLASIRLRAILASRGGPGPRGGG